MNDNWRVGTTTGTYAVKRIVDVDIARMRRQHQVTAALAALGAPVVAPLSTADGETVAHLPSGAYTATPWADGSHRPGPGLSLAESGSYGLLLGRLHRLLSEMCPVPTTPPPEPAQPVDEALGTVNRYLDLIGRRGVHDDFDRVALAHLRTRRDLLNRYADARPASAATVTAGWTHGDFHDLNVLWRGSRVSAVLDWDRLRVQGYAFELLRAAVLSFGRDGSPDLARIAAFAAGYRTAMPLGDDEMVDATRHFWWRRLCHLWPLSPHYDRGDTSCDHLFATASATTHWWTSRRDSVDAALSGR